MDLSTIKLRSDKDPYRSAEARGWKITDASTLSAPMTLEADVVIVGSGAGGGTAAETLSKAGIDVVILEAGPLKSSTYFDLNEREAYRDLYQEGTGRATKDGSIPILQGRSVGGSTTVNWTSSFRTPPETLGYWADQLGVKGCSVAELEPYFVRMEERLGIGTWQMAPNNNNDVLRRAADKLGYSWQKIPRNVRGCMNLGFCGMGCPVDAKQSMLVTTIPGALDHGARLVHHAQVERILIEGDRVVGVEGWASDASSRKRTANTITVRAKRTILAGGGINNPGILLRSKAPDPHGRIGKRTFLHPTTLTFGYFDHRIDPFYGAPQSLYSDHFQWKDGVSGPIGFKLEAPPLHPGFTAAFYGARGEGLTASMDRLPYTNSLIALLRDGFHEDSVGGAIELDGNDRPLIDYPISDYVLEGVKRAQLTMAEMQFAAGATAVLPGHKQGRQYTSWKEAREAIAALDHKPHKATIGSAHVMGGCAMGEDPKQSVTDSNGKFHHLDDLYVMDGSLFPTSIGANPQLSIYGLVLKHASNFAASMKGA